MYRMYNTAVMNVFAELGECIAIDEEQTRYQEMYDELNRFIQENIENHTMNLTKEIIGKSTKDTLKFDIIENGFGGRITDNLKTTKNQMITYIANLNIKTHYDDTYKQNNIRYHKNTLEMLKNKLKTINSISVQEDIKQYNQNLEYYSSIEFFENRLVDFKKK